MSLETSGTFHAARPSEDLLADWASLIRAEYCEMPGLSLTDRQVERLWRLDRPTATFLLNDLIAAGFLRCNARGAYVRADVGSC